MDSWIFVGYSLLKFIWILIVPNLVIGCVFKLTSSVLCHAQATSSLSTSLKLVLAHFLISLVLLCGYWESPETFYWRKMFRNQACSPKMHTFWEISGNKKVLRIWWKLKRKQFSKWLRTLAWAGTLTSRRCEHRPHLDDVLGLISGPAAALVTNRDKAS